MSNYIDVNSNRANSQDSNYLAHPTDEELMLFIDEAPLDATTYTRIKSHLLHEKCPSCWDFLEDLREIVVEAAQLPPEAAELDTREFVVIPSMQVNPLPARCYILPGFQAGIQGLIAEVTAKISAPAVLQPQLQAAGFEEDPEFGLNFESNNGTDMPAMKAGWVKIKYTNSLISGLDVTILRKDEEYWPPEWEVQLSWNDKNTIEAQFGEDFTAHMDISSLSFIKDLNDLKNCKLILRNRSETCDTPET